MSCLYACAYVWAGVCGCVWLRLIRSSWESSPLGYISSCHALSLVRSLQFAVDVYEAFLVPGFRDSWALLLSWTPIAGDSSAHCFPALPASAPTESSVSAYGKLRFCLRRAPRLPTEAPPLCLRKAPFSFSLCITSCNKLSFSATESSRLHCDTSRTKPRASFTKQGKLAGQHSSKTEPMGEDISAGDLLTTTRKLKNTDATSHLHINQCNIPSITQISVVATEQ